MIEQGRLSELSSEELLSDSQRQAEIDRKREEHTRLNISSALIDDTGQVHSGETHAKIRAVTGIPHEVEEDFDRIGWLVDRAIGEPVFVSVNDFEASGSYTGAIDRKLNIEPVEGFSGRVVGSSCGKNIQGFYLNDAILLENGDAALGDSYRQIIETNGLNPDAISPQRIGWYHPDRHNFVSKADLENVYNIGNFLNNKFYEV